MPTADRTTLKAALDELLTRLRGSLTATPPTPARPFRSVETGLGEDHQRPRPFLAVRVVETEPIATVDDDKIIALTLALRVVTDEQSGDAQAALLDSMGAVEDCLDSLRDTGIVEGSEGIEDRRWELKHSQTTAGARLVTAECACTLVVKVKRESNRAAS